jgi:S-DNA-T family DNA segregation ATPase FtsK/SpoIIIE
MKTEHRDIIDRARLSGLPPSYLAHELLVHDLVESGLFELKNLHSPYGKLNEGQQQEVIDRLTEAAEKAVHNAISIISSRNVSTIEVTMKEVKFNSKQLTLTSIVDAKDPNRHDLIDSAGRICLLVMAPDDYNEGLDFIQPDRDQHDLPLHVSDLTGNLFAGGAGPDEPDGEHPLGTADDLAERTGEARPVSEFAEVGKEFGEFTYDDAAQLIVLKAAPSFGIDWMQSRLAISSEQAETLLLRLIDNQVVELLIEGDTWTENTYTVIATLDDLGQNLSVE